MAQNVAQDSFAHRLGENSTHRASNTSSNSSASSSKDSTVFSHPPSASESTATTPCVTSDRELLEEWEEELTRFEMHRQQDEPRGQMQLAQLPLPLPLPQPQPSRFRPYPPEMYTQVYAPPMYVPHPACAMVPYGHHAGVPAYQPGHNGVLTAAGMGAAQALPQSSRLRRMEGMANPPFLYNNWGLVDTSAGVAQPAVYDGQPAMQSQIPQQGSSSGSGGSNKGKRRATDDDAPVVKKKKKAVAPRTDDAPVVQFIEESGGSTRLLCPACQRSFTRSDSLKRHRGSKKCQANQRANTLRDVVPGANANEASTTSRAPPLPVFAQDVHITVQAQGSEPRVASEAPPLPVVAVDFSIGVTKDDTNFFGSP